MATILTELLAARRIKKLDGDEDRFAKIEQAAKNLSEKFKESPSFIVQAVITGLCDMPDDDDPIISIATDQLTDAWKSVRTAYTDIPKPLLQSIILDACSRLIDIKDCGYLTEAIWLTAIDTVPLCRMDKKVFDVVHGALNLAFDVAYKSNLAPNNGKKSTINKNADVVKKLQKVKYEATPVKQTITYDALRMQIMAASGPQWQNSQNQQLDVSDPNRHWPNGGQAWSIEFAPRMAKTLFDLYNDIYANLSQRQTGVDEALSEAFSAFSTTYSDSLKSLSQTYGLKLKQTSAASDIIWWLESLYSQSMIKSYREMKPIMAAILMPLDLLDITYLPAPLSVGYVLMEAVNKIPNAHFGDGCAWEDFFKNIRKNKDSIPDSILNEMAAPQQSGCLSIRDAIVSALTLTTSDYNAQTICKRAQIDIKEKIDLPSIAHILFKQEQAVRLVRSAK